MTMTTDRTCPSWCTGCDVDIDGGRFHYSAEVTLPGSDDHDGPNERDARVFAMYSVGHEQPDGLLFRVDVNHFLTPAEVRQTAAALLNIADALE
jgi:hypothetical protein